MHVVNNRVSDCRWWNAHPAPLPAMTGGRKFGNVRAACVSASSAADWIRMPGTEETSVELVEEGAVLVESPILPVRVFLCVPLPLCLFNLNTCYTSLRVYNSSDN